MCACVCVCVCTMMTTHTLFTLAPMPGDYERYYGFSQFAIELNEMEEGLEEKLPCTDCRFRTDQRSVLLPLF